MHFIIFSPFFPIKIALCDSFKETEEEIEINILLFYLKESHKAILIGKKGENIIKCIKQVASEIQQFSDKKLKIKIKAKLNEKWKENWETLDKFYKIN
jgi:GTPase Era involved in 16S rRNA processing